jgi:crotonobetainyl-CoA:carnitine CoA-transferase CaiB-like acyl-CoA transferase
MKGLEGVRVVEVGGVAAMPLAGMLMGSWGADVIHVEPPGRGDMQREMVPSGMSGWGRPHEVNYLWEHVDRNKKSIAINMGSAEGQGIVHKLIETADVFVNNLRPYELEKFKLGYEAISKVNPKIIYANLTGYGMRGPEKNAGGYDSVAFWARSGVMDLMHEPGTAPNISRPAYGDSVTALSLLAGIVTSLFIRERTGQGQEVEVSLFNTATWVLGYDITSSLVTGKDALRPQRKDMANPLRNIYPTKDERWIMLGMTNAQRYWPAFCQALGKPELENDAKFAAYEDRAEHSAELVEIIEEVFKTKTYEELKALLTEHKVVWAPVNTPLEVTQDEQALANDFFLDWDHPTYGRIRVLNNPIKLSKTPAGNRLKGPDLGEHTDELMRELGYPEDEIRAFRENKVIG